ncbi:MAG: chemotaxis-specific protein-glutamate methyltransferase CheB [Magnetococcales bacterium]|nr:chemotaxis-specific protein-glutamate methyltransferase CheB [Magnetococcales bacterium]
MNTRTIRVVVVDDSMLVRQWLRDLLAEAEDIDVIGEAASGRQAVEVVAALRPDLVTMDLEMPGMGGLEAIETIMCSKAVPILVVTSVSDARVAMEAMQRGALDVIEKPDTSPESVEQLIAKVRLLSGVTVVTRMRPGHATHWATRPVMTPEVGTLQTFPRLFAIASSMGGPQALARILPELPAGFSCPVVIAQHISDGFAPGLVEWLSSLCVLPVRLAVDGESLQAGTIYISPSESHFTISPARRVALMSRTIGDIYRPSCDLLLQSVADCFGPRAVGIILTGMGNDGAEGIVRILDKGGLTLAQDEATSLIFGMNQMAIRTGSVQRVLPVEAIASEMIRLAHAPVSNRAGVEKP